MRISIMGAHSTGKSTLGKELCRLLKFNFIPDAALLAYKNNFAINENTPPETQLWILSKQLEFERNTPPSWIEEKSLYDNLIYGRFAKQPARVIKVMEEIIERNAHYDLIFYLPIEFEIEDDGIRSLDKTFQQTIDKSLRAYLREKNLPFIILRGSVEERVRKALRYIRLFTKYSCKIVNCRDYA